MDADLWLFLLAGIAGGAVNAAAGGAKLFVFPLLMAAGLPPLMANATGTVALWPAQFTATLAYRRHLKDFRPLALRLLPALFGAFAGACALILSSERFFEAMIPFVLVLAVLAIALGNRTAVFLRQVVPAERMAGLSLVLMFAAGFYGGFFGAGLGFLIVAILLVTEAHPINRANAEKNLVAFSINTTAVAPLALSRLVDWRAAAGVIAGGLVGGYLGAVVARSLPETLLRIGVAAMGCFLTLAFLYANG